MPNITSVTVTFGNGLKREEYGPVKKAEASITAAVDDKEDGEAILAEIGQLALAQVAAMLDAPKPAVANRSQEDKQPEPEAEESKPPTRRKRRTKQEKLAEKVAEEKAEAAEEAEPAEDKTEEADEWATDSGAIEITDQELLAATSKRAGELGARDPILKLIGTFATRTDGPPFKVQEIAQAQRKEYLDKLKALTA